MPDPGLPRRDPVRLRAEALVLPDTFDHAFEGFSPEAFAILERLRRHPHIEQYRADKEDIKQYIQAPFKRYRDDLVVNWVLPNRLAFETERNVFSRLLKNDFGAGGCHHHLWMAFYRPGRRRLTDFQLSHSLYPDGFNVGLYVGDYATDLLAQAKARIAAEPEQFLARVNPLLEGGWRLFFYAGSGKTAGRLSLEEPMEQVPADLKKANGIWVRTAFSQEEVLRWKGQLAEQALAAVHQVWPVYHFFGNDRY